MSHDNEQNFERKLQPGAIAALENQLKTKLDRKQLDQETRINSEDDAANCLFNGVVHIYNRINQLTNREENVGGGTLPDNVKDVLDEVMEYEPSENVPDINDLVFDDNNEDEDYDNDDEVITGLEVVTVQSRLFLSDLQGLGWATIDKVKVNEVRQHAKDRLSRKSDMMKYIVLQVINMKTISGDISVCEEKGVEVEPIWTDYLNELLQLNLQITLSSAHTILAEQVNPSHTSSLLYIGRPRRDSMIEVPEG